MALAGTATRAVVGAVRRSAVLNTRHSVRSVLHSLAVVCEVARGRTGSRKIPTSINVANEGSVTGVSELGVQPAGLIIPPRPRFSVIISPRFSENLRPLTL